MINKTTHKFYSCKGEHMNHQTEQTSLNLYDKVYKDNQGVVAYPWRVSAGHKFEAMGAMAFFQSQMNNHHLVREYYKSSLHHQDIKVRMIHGDHALYDLKYKTNYDASKNRIHIAGGQAETKMLVEFKLITYESMMKYGFEGAIQRVFKYKDQEEKRGYKFLQRAANSYMDRLNMVVLGMTNTRSSQIIPNSSADVFEQIICIGYMPASGSHKNKVITRKVVNIFHSFNDFACCVHNAISPHQLFEMMEENTHVDHTIDFINQFGLP